MEQAINWMLARVGRVSYSMTNRNGPSSYDCSSAVYHALKRAGIFPQSLAVGWTGLMFTDLPKYGFVEVGAKADGSIDARRGDIFLWLISGTWGTPGGGAHTGIFTDANNIVHCNYSYGMSVNNHDAFAAASGVQQLRVFRYVGGTAVQTQPQNQVSTDPRDQIVEFGSFIRFDGEYRVAELVNVSNRYEVRLDRVSPVTGFTWADNGIPVGPLVEVANGYATDDQYLDIGSRVVVPGKYVIQDIGQTTDGAWLGKISMDGLSFWIDLAAATEIAESDPGKVAPGKKPKEEPKPAPKEEKPAATEPKTEQPATNPEIPDNSTPEEGAKTAPEAVESTETEKTSNNPSESEKNDEKSEEIVAKEQYADKSVNLTEDQMAKLEQLEEKINAQLNEVAESEEVEKIKARFSDRTKTIVYIIGDTLIGLGLLVPSLAILFGLSDVNVITAMAALFSQAGGWLLVMFGIMKGDNKK